MKKEQIEIEVMSLSMSQKAELASKLLISLDQESEPDIEESWLVEAKRRARELESGSIKPISAEVVRKKVQALLR